MIIPFVLIVFFFFLAMRNDCEYVKDVENQRQVSIKLV